MYASEFSDALAGALLVRARRVLQRKRGGLSCAWKALLRLPEATEMSGLCRDSWRAASAAV